MFSERRYNTRPNFSGRRYQERSIVFALIIANVGIFILQNLTSAPQDPYLRSGLTPWIWLSPETLMNFQIWRLGTYMFAHAPGLGHIFFNMWALYIFGKPLENRIGGNRFLNLYLLSGLIGAGLWLVFNWQHASQPIIGASGAVFGVLAAAAMLFPNQQYMLLIPPVPIKLKTLAFVFGGIEVLMALNQADNVAHLAHLGGMIGGFIYVRWYFPRNRSGGRRRTGVMASIHKNIKKFLYKRNFMTSDSSSTQRRGSQHFNKENFTSEEVDRILDKIGEQGISSLTPREKRILEQARERLKGKN